MVIHWSRGCYSGAGALFVDRDGVVNRRVRDGYVLSWEDFVPNERFVEAAQPFARRGVPLVFTSYQSCVGRGLMDVQRMRDLFSLMILHLRDRGIPVAAYFCCPHAPDDGCECRKPKPGLLLAAGRRLGIALHRSAFIGDEETGVAAGTAAGVYSLLTDADDPQQYMQTFSRARHFMMNEEAESRSLVATV